MCGTCDFLRLCRQCRNGIQLCVDAVRDCARRGIRARLGCAAFRNSVGSSRYAAARCKSAAEQEERIQQRIPRGRTMILLFFSAWRNAAWRNYETTEKNPLNCTHIYGTDAIIRTECEKSTAQKVFYDSLQPMRMLSGVVCRRRGGNKRIRWKARSYI